VLIDDVVNQRKTEAELTSK